MKTLRSPRWMLLSLSLAALAPGCELPSSPELVAHQALDKADPEPAKGVGAACTSPAAGSQVNMPFSAWGDGTAPNPPDNRKFAFWQKGLPQSLWNNLLFRRPVTEATPTSATQVRARRDQIRGILWELMAPLTKAQAERTWADVKVVSSRDFRTPGGGNLYTQQVFYFYDALGLPVTGQVLIPDSAKGKMGTNPAILYHHYHGSEFTLGTHELFHQNLGWQFGERFVDEGYVVFAIDAMGHGPRLDPTRHSDSRGWEAEQDYDVITYLYGLSRLQVRCLDDMTAFRILQSLPMVNKRKIGAIGMSMGSARSYLLAALLPEELGAAAALGTMPRMQDSIAQLQVQTNLNAHFFPGELARGIETESVMLAAAGIPLRLIMGTEDGGSPGWPLVFSYNRKAWAMLGMDRLLVTQVLSGVGHNWVPTEINATVAWLNAQLR